MSAAPHVFRSARIDGRRRSRAVEAHLVRALPLWGAVLAAVAIVSRRPDAITNAQFWAEDGTMFFADVYRHGLLASMLVPQSGYFQELPLLASGLATLVPLKLAPLVMNLVALAIRVLPVGLLLHRRARSISPHLWARVVIAVLYVGLPGVAETNVNVDNALWYLAIAALITLMLEPPRHRAARALDGAILSMCAVTGVFSIALAPLAVLYRRRVGAARVPTWMIAILGAGALLQLFAIGFLEFHLPAGFDAAPRTTLSLHATALLFLEIVGRRVVLQPLGLEHTQLAPVGIALTGLLGLIAFGEAFRRGNDPLRLLLAFAGALLAMALAHPQGATWAQLAQPLNSGRYFVIPQYAAAAALLWHAANSRRWIRAGTGLALCFVVAVAIPAGWRYAPFQNLHFQSQATRFAHARPGTTMTFPLNPVGRTPRWAMTLVKR